MTNNGYYRIEYKTDKSEYRVVHLNIKDNSEPTKAYFAKQVKEWIQDEEEVLLEISKVDLVRAQERTYDLWSFIEKSGMYERVLVGHTDMEYIEKTIKFLTEKDKFKPILQETTDLTNEEEWAVGEALNAKYGYPKKQEEVKPLIFTKNPHGGEHLIEPPEQTTLTFKQFNELVFDNNLEYTLENGVYTTRKGDWTYVTKVNNNEN